MSDHAQDTPPGDVLRFDAPMGFLLTANRDAIMDVYAIVWLMQGATEQHADKLHERANEIITDFVEDMDLVLVDPMFLDDDEYAASLSASIKRVYARYLEVTQP